MGPQQLQTPAPNAVRLEAGLLELSTAAGNTLLAAKCRGLLRGYHQRWHASDLVPIAVEKIVASELWNPETNRRSRSFTVAGKEDLIATRDGRTVLVDHKTTSEDIADPAAPYWRQLVVEGQVSHYMMLEWLNGNKIDEAVWDVIRKPSISPRLLGKKDLEVVLARQEYFDHSVSDDDIEALSREPRETFAMYEARLAHDCSAERPEWYFQRRTVLRLDSEILEWAGELWGHSQDILISRRENRWPRNSGACMMYGSPCKFLGICSGHDAADSDRWKRKTCVHAELPVVGDGRDVLTNSRIRCFQTCRRKHYFEYELGIERAEEEISEALYFGQIWHLALETYFKGELNVNDNGGSAGSELATAGATTAASI